MIKRCFVPVLLLGLIVGSCGQPPIGVNYQVEGPYSEKVDSVLKLMTLEEKIGQMNQYSSDQQATGPSRKDSTKLEQIRQGKVGSMLNVKGAANTRRFQEAAMQSRLRIPLLFGLDVIHGMRTVYPIPLAEAASFNLDLMERTAAAAAKEASSEGIHWTFAPMVDVTRDARWGRVMEGAGEDAWYGSRVAEARVRGFQGKSLSDTTTILACAKHFAAYGACIGGRDYNTVDISRLTLHEVYLPPFRAAQDAGVATFMSSFNEVDGIPATGNMYLLREILKGKWGFGGFVVSDWNSVGEMLNHGLVADLKGAAYHGVSAGCDMDMESRAYTSHLEDLVKEGAVDEAYIDDAVRRILLKKFELGLFDDPFRYCDEQRQQRTVLSQELKDVAREAGRSSIVLLKNETKVLPLEEPKRIAVIGALTNSQVDMLGSWAIEGVEEEVVTVLQGIKNRYPNSVVTYADRPAYAFGYGLSYTTFEISKPIMTKVSYDRGETIECKVMVKNCGPCKGKETVQLYIRDLVSSVTRPVKELKGICQLTLEPGEQKEVSFTLNEKDLGFYNKDLDFITEPGDFELMVGNSSDNVEKCVFSYN